MEHQLLINNEQHEKELAITDAKLEAKGVECNEVATLDHARRRGESKAMQMSDNKVSAMKDETSKKIGAAKCLDIIPYHLQIKCDLDNIC